MADYTLNTSNLTQCGGNILNNTLYTAVYVKLISQDASAGTSKIHVQIALWASYASGNSYRDWNGSWALYNSAGTTLLSGTYSGRYYNYTSAGANWPVNGDYTIQHGRSGTTWTAISILGVNVQCNTQSHGSVTNAHRNFTPNSGTNWYTYGIVPAMTTSLRTVTLNQNGGSGGTTSVSIRYGTPAGSYPSITRPTRTGYTFAGYYTATSGGTQYYNSAGNSVREFNYNSNTTWYAQWTANNYYLDLNGTLDGVSSGNISGYGTADVTVGGTLRSNDCADYYTAHPYGSSYSITDIKATTGHVYLGVSQGSTSGTIGAANVGVRLSFYSQTIWVYHNGWHRAIPWVYHNGWHRALAKVYNGGWKNCKT